MCVCKWSLVMFWEFRCMRGPSCGFVFGSVYIVDTISRCAPSQLKHEQLTCNADLASGQIWMLQRGQHMILVKHCKWHCKQYLYKTTNIQLSASQHGMTHTVTVLGDPGFLVLEAWIEQRACNDSTWKVARVVNSRFQSSATPEPLGLIKALAAAGSNNSMWWSWTKTRIEKRGWVADVCCNPINRQIFWHSF